VASFKGPPVVPVGMKHNNAVAQVVVASMFIAVLAGFALVLTIGVGDSINVIQNDTGNLTAGSTAYTTFNTNATAGFDLPDRAIVLGAWLVVLGPAGIGAITMSGASTGIGRKAVQWAVPFVAVVSAVGFYDLASDVLFNSYDWSAAGDGAAALAAFCAAGMVAGAGQLMGYRTR